MKNAAPLALTLALVAFLATGFAVADQHDHADHSGHHATAKNIYAPAMDAMHKNMMAETTGDADVDFVTGMIPHHQGAVDMAKILKENGKDPELQKLADEIIAAQEREIAFMQAWLAKNKKD